METDWFASQPFITDMNGIAAAGRKRRVGGAENVPPAMPPRTAKLPGTHPAKPVEAAPQDIEEYADLVAEIDETARNQTVEEFLRAQCEERIAEIFARADQIADELRGAFEDRKMALFDAMAQKTAEVAKAQAKGAAMKINVHAAVIEGPHEGETFLLKPRQKRLTPKLGRSTGHQFVKNGISLPDDPEVSTTHAKFQALCGKIFYTDLGSTNGTSINGVDLEPQKPQEIRDGDVIRAGRTVIAITLQEE